MAGRHRAGLLQLDPRRGDREKKGYISFLYLTPEQRHNGVGVQLIGKAVSLYRPLGREDLQLSCSEANQPALSFYEKYGFRRTGSAARGLRHPVRTGKAHRLPQPGRAGVRAAMERDFLPISREDLLQRGWYYYDFLLITGDAYVDHPSFGTAIISRVLEAEGYRVAILPHAVGEQVGLGV